MMGDADLGNPHMCFDSKREIQAGTDPLQRLPNFRKYCDPLVKHNFVLMTITRLSNGLKMVGVTPGSTLSGKNLPDHAAQYPADFFKRPKEIMSAQVGRLNMFYEVTGRRVYPTRNNGAAAYCANKYGITYGYPYAYACTANYAVDSYADFTIGATFDTVKCKTMGQTWQGGY
jgi:hypothetical protein